MPKGVAKGGKRILYPVECKICKEVLTHTGMNGHIATHKLTVQQYVEKYGEYRPHVLKRSNLEVECMECHQLVKSLRQLSFHLRIEHSMSGEEYAMKHIFNNEPQVCKCGCNTSISILPRPPWRRDYLPGHNPNGMTGRLHTSTTKTVLTQKSIARYARGGKNSTDPENRFEVLLNALNLSYEKQVQTSAGVCDFYLPVLNLYVEIDGEYWHPLHLENLNIQLLTSAVGDRKKNIALPNLIRIRSQDIQHITSPEDIVRYNKLLQYPTGTVSLYTVILSKDYITAKMQQNEKYFSTHLYLLLKFIRTFQPEFPDFESRESLREVIQKVPKRTLTVYNPATKTFNNNCSSIGNSYLKSIFRSYWNTRYKAGKSPCEIWQDDHLMTSIIKYRIGLNDNREVYDFSLYNLIKGISAIRGTVSFFKPVLAGAIYHHFLGDCKKPVVLDPCAGFGGRMLGFKSMYPEGVYVGIEPNKDTFKELERLKEEGNFGDTVQLLNIKFEDYKMYDTKFDLVFTSVPYYDLEIYTDPVEYKNQKEWAEVFLKEFYKYSNVLINLPETLGHYFPSPSETYHMSHNASHLSNRKVKRELIIKV